MKKKRTISKSVLLTYSILVLGILPKSGQAAYERVKERTIFNGEKISEYKFKNGLRLLYLPRKQAEVLTYQVWFDVGSIDEKLNEKLKRTGLAHLFEHMMFRGTKSYPAGKFNELSSRLGVDRQNATTYFYRTNYFEDIPSKQLPKMMELESDRMRNLDLTEELLTKEKGAVVGELRRILDSPMSLAYDEINRLAFPHTPFQYTVIGTEKEIREFKLAEAQYFYKTFYAPNNATIIVIGNVAESELLALIEKYYGDMPSQEIPRVEIPEEPAQTKERRLETTHPQATSQILVMAYRIPSVSSPDFISLSLMGAHLSSGMEARLRKTLVDKGIAVRASAGPSSRPDSFNFTVALSEHHTAEEALKVIDQEINLLKSKAISTESFERARNQELLSLYNDIGDNSSFANMLGEYLMLDGDYMRAFEIIDGYKKLKPADLREAAKKYLKKETRSIVIVRPKKKVK